MRDTALNRQSSDVHRNSDCIPGFETCDIPGAVSRCCSNATFVEILAVFLQTKWRLFTKKNTRSRAGTYLHYV
jgi:hypothetical protein